MRYLPPAPPRETVFQALFALASEVQWGDPPRGFKTVSRRVKLFSDVAINQQPACYQAEHTEMSQQITNLPYKRTWGAQWIIYQATGKSPGGIPTIENNLILDAVEKALAPKPQDPGFPDQRNTLNGLVWHCFIDGTVFKDPGDIDDQGMLVVPITLLVP